MRNLNSAKRLFIARLHLGYLVDTTISPLNSIFSTLDSHPELKDILTPIFKQNGVRQAILFGSYADGYATPQSDVDLLVDSGLRGLAFFGLLFSADSRISKEIRESGVEILGS